MALTPSPTLRDRLGGASRDSSEQEARAELVLGLTQVQVGLLGEQRYSIILVICCVLRAAKPEDVRLKGAS